MRKILLILLFSVTVFAQEESKVPQYDEQDRILLKGVLLLNTQADNACKDLPQMKNLNEHYAEVKKFIEAKYKGFELNGVNLVAKVK